MDVEDTLHKMQLHEWASEQRLEILEVNLRDKILQKITLVEEAVKYGMDTALFGRLQAIETRMVDQSQEKLLQRVKQLEERLKQLLESQLMAKVQALETKVQESLDKSKGDVKQQVNSQLAVKLAALEQQLHYGLKKVVADKIQGRQASTKEWVDQLSDKLQQRQVAGLEDVKNHITDQAAVAKEEGGGGGSYLVPVGVLGVVILGVTGFFYYQYDKLRKTHIL
jgi:hypothetical protein